MEMQVKKLHEDAIVPQFAHDDDAGMDVYAVEEVTIAPGERVQVKTGVAVALPHGTAALVWDKSGLSHKHGLKVLGGVMDAGYRGEWMIGLINLGAEAYTVEKGHKVAQVLIQRVEHPTVTEVAEFDVEETSRGAGGFGSTGK